MAHTIEDDLLDVTDWAGDLVDEVTLSATVDASTFSVEASEPVSVEDEWGATPTQTAWVMLTVAARRAYQFDLDGSDYDTVLFLLDDSFNVVDYDDDSPGELWSQLNISLDPGTYYLYIFPYVDDDAGSLTVNIWRSSASYIGEFSADAEIFVPTFTADAELVAWPRYDRRRHERDTVHYGSTPATLVMHDAATLEYTIRDLCTRILALEEAIPITYRRAAQFLADAQMTPYFTADAALQRVVVGSWLADALAMWRYEGSLNADATLMPRMLADAVINATQAGSIVSDSVLRDYAAEVMADSPVAYWKMGESSGNPQDSSGNGHHMTSVTGSPTYSQGGIPGSPATSILFSASGQYCTLSSLPAGLQLTTWTLEGWYYSTDGTPGAKSCLITEAFAGDGTVRYALGGFGDAGVGSRRCTGGFYNGSWRRVIDGSDVPSGAWTHFVTTYDGSTVRLYRNGVSVGTPLSYTGTPSGTEALYLGRSWDTTAGIDGRLAHLAIYSGALSSTRIAVHYTAGI